MQVILLVHGMQQDSFCQKIIKFLCGFINNMMTKMMQVKLVHGAIWFMSLVILMNMEEWRADGFIQDINNQIYIVAAGNWASKLLTQTI